MRFKFNILLSWCRAENDIIITPKKFVEVHSHKRQLHSIGIYSNHRHKICCSALSYVKTITKSPNSEPKKSIWEWEQRGRGWVVGQTPILQ